MIFLNDFTDVLTKIIISTLFISSDIFSEHINTDCMLIFLLKMLYMLCLLLSELFVYNHILMKCIL